MEEKSSKLTFWQFLGTLKWLFVYNVKLAPLAAIAEIIATLFSALSPLINAYIFARLLDKIIKIATSGSSPTEIIPFLGILLLYNLLNSAINYSNGYFGSVMGNANAYRAPQILYRHISSLGIQTLENPEVANKIQRTREIFMMLNSDFDRMILFFSRVITLIFAALIVVKVMPVVVAIIFISMLPGLVSNKIHMRKQWNLYRSETENKRRANFVFSSLIETTNLQEVSITSAYGHLNNIYRTFAERYMREDLKIIKNWQFFGFLLGAITSFASIFGYFTILKNLFKGIVSVGDVTFQMRSLDVFVSNLSMVGNSFVSLYERSIRINEVKEVFDMKAMISDGDISMEKKITPPIIEFKNVSFKYPNSERYILKNLDIEIKPGEKIAIVGENGAGKTTLVKLLCRFYKTSKGKVLLDGKDINEINIDSWYKNLGVLFQDFNTNGSLTLRENILLGNSEAAPDEEKIKLAAKKANVDSFVGNYPNGYDQVLSEKFKGGVRPSTGQWQKIAIARFFYRDSPVVVFDEPTASIDAVSEAEIFGQIYDFFKNKTVIIISHRFSTVRNADKIYVLADGKIAESGTHKELLKLKGRYYKAFNIQAKGYK